MPGDAYCSDAYPCCFGGDQLGVCYNDVCCLMSDSDCSADPYSCCEGFACEQSGGVSTCIALS